MLLDSALGASARRSSSVESTAYGAGSGVRGGAARRAQDSAFPAASMAGKLPRILARGTWSLASSSVNSSAPGRSSSSTASVCIGSSAPPKRLLLLRAPRASALTLPTFCVSSVSTRSDSPYSTRRSKSASVAMRAEALRAPTLADVERNDAVRVRGAVRELLRHVVATRLEHDAEREREQDEQEHERHCHAESATARRLARRGDRQRGDPGYAARRRVARQHVVGRHAEGPRVGLQEAT